METTRTKPPRYWSLLTPEHQREYEMLREELEPLAIRTLRSQLGSTFAEAITKIRSYTMRGDSDDWKRCMICGLVWLEPDPERGRSGAFAISTIQLSKLFGKCKSSINAGFQALGYGVTPLSVAHGSSLIRLFPFMRNSARQMREWTIRSEISPLPVVSADWQAAAAESGKGEGAPGTEPAPVAYENLVSTPLEPFGLEWDPFPFGSYGETEF
jgi:hypothetical protein